jgi:hypothetical protein
VLLPRISGRLGARYGLFEGVGFPVLARPENEPCLEDAYAAARDYEDISRQAAPNLAAKVDAGQIDVTEALAIFWIRQAESRLRDGIAGIVRLLAEVGERIGQRPGGDRIWSQWLGRFGWDDAIAAKVMGFADGDEIDDALADAMLKCVETRAQERPQAGD